MSSKFLIPLVVAVLGGMILLAVERFLLDPRQPGAPYAEPDSIDMRAAVEDVQMVQTGTAMDEHLPEIGFSYFSKIRCTWSQVDLGYICMYRAQRDVRHELLESEPLSDLFNATFERRFDGSGLFYHTGDGWNFRDLD